MNSFLVKKDYRPSLRDEVLSTLTRANDITLEDAELMAQAEMESYLNSRYDVAAIFPPISEYDNLVEYAEGEYVWYDNAGTVIVRTASQDTTGNLPTDTEYWDTDGRNKHIVRLAIDITAFLIYKSANPRQIPDHVGEGYAAAIAWLEMVAANELSPDLPLKDADDSGMLFKGGSTTQQSHYW